MGGYEREIDGLQGRIAELEAENALLSDSVDESNKFVEAVKCKLEIIEEGVRGNAERRVTLEAENARLDKERRAANVACADLHGELKDAVRFASSAKACQDGMSIRLAKSEAEVERLREAMPSADRLDKISIVLSLLSETASEEKMFYDLREMARGIRRAQDA